MGASRGLLAGLLSLAALTSSDRAEAGPISLSFAGEIDSEMPSTGALARIMEGDAFVGTFQVNLDSARATLSGDDVLFSDVILESSLDLRVGDLALAAAPDAIGSFVARDSTGGDFVLADFQFGQTASAPAERFQIEFLFENFAGSLFDAGGQLLLPTDLARFDRASLRIFPVDPSGSLAAPVTGRIRSASVPEPSAAASLAFALLALAAQRCARLCVPQRLRVKTR